MVEWYFLLVSVCEAPHKIIRRMSPARSPLCFALLISMYFSLPLSHVPLNAPAGVLHHVSCHSSLCPCCHSLSPCIPSPAPVLSLYLALCTLPEILCSQADSQCLIFSSSCSICDSLHPEWPSDLPCGDGSIYLQLNFFSPCAHSVQMNALLIGSLFALKPQKIHHLNVFVTCNFSSKLVIIRSIWLKFKGMGSNDISAPALIGISLCFTARHMSISWCCVSVLQESQPALEKVLTEAMLNTPDGAVSLLSPLTCFESFSAVVCDVSRHSVETRKRDNWSTCQDHRVYNYNSSIRYPAANNVVTDREGIH